MVAISLTVGLVLMQYGHAASNATQTAMDNTMTMASNASSNATGTAMQEANELISAASNPLYQQKNSLQALLDYCFQHADRPNPVQDLIDKGFLSETFTGETCISVRQMYNEVETKIREFEEKQLAEFEEEQQKQQQKQEAIFKEKEDKAFRYDKCLLNALNSTMTFEECARILNGTK